MPNKTKKADKAAQKKRSFFRVIFLLSPYSIFSKKENQKISVKKNRTFWKNFPSLTKAII
jgi:hypothetical protein